jgi:hypothetical protein
VAALVLLAPLGCTNTSDSLRQELKAEQASWAREVATLRVQQGALSDRLNRQFATTAGRSADLGPAQRRMRVVLDGTRQSIVDVELQTRQSASRTEHAIERGGEEAERTLTQERERVNAYLQTMTSQLATAGQELDALVSTGSDSKAN